MRIACRRARRGVRALPAGPVGFVLLGAGAGAAAHAEALTTLPGARLVAVVDPDLGRARSSPGRTAPTPATRRRPALARDDVQAACIVAPNHAHAALARAAAAHGVAVLVEKPVGRDAGEAQAIVDELRHGRGSPSASCCRTGSRPRRSPFARPSGPEASADSWARSSSCATTGTRDTSRPGPGAGSATARAAGPSGSRRST